MGTPADDQISPLELSQFADRLDDLAATADLMGDEPTAVRWRTAATEARLKAMARTDGR